MADDSWSTGVKEPVNTVILTNNDDNDDHKHGYQNGPHLQKQQTSIHCHLVPTMVLSGHLSGYLIYIICYLYNVWCYILIVNIWINIQKVKKY